MEKVICEICGTVFPDDAEKCPLCGCSRDFLLEDTGDILAEEAALAGAVSAGSRKKGKVFDFDEVNQEKPARNARPVEDYEEDEDEDEEDEEEPRTNVFLVVILLILIVLLLLAAGFFYLRYFLPNMKEEPVQTEPIVTVIETEPVQTEDPGIPCTNLMMDGGKMELAEGGKKLLNVHVYPEDTTDAVVYQSGDEAVVTVSEDGTVTAVGEGTTVITITCGDQQIKCNVTVDYDATEVTVPDETIPAPVVENADEPQPEGETQSTEATDATEPTDATEATEEETVPAGTELKLKKTDITIGSNYTSVKLEMDCEIKPEDVSWFTMDSTIAICHDGVVTSTGSGLTRIYGEYEGQQVECIVRCIF